MAQSAPITTSITITVVMPYASATIPKIGVKIPPKLADNPMVTPEANPDVGHEKWTSRIG